MAHKAILKKRIVKTGNIYAIIVPKALIDADVLDQDQEYEIRIFQAKRHASLGKNLLTATKASVFFRLFRSNGLKGFFGRLPQQKGARSYQCQTQRHLSA